MKVTGILLLVLALYLYLAALSPGTIETGDTYLHYQISRYSLRHPELLLDMWGRPIFTLLTVPFSLFGLMGMRLFDIVAAVASAYVTYQTAKCLNKPNPEMSALFVLFSVLYIETVLSGLTEPLFNLVLISAIYLHVKGKTEWAAKVCSFSPFVREEGYILICAYATLLILKSRYSSLKYMIVGLIIFNSLGYLLTGQPAWLITSNTHSRWILKEYYDKTPHKGPMHYIGTLPENIGSATTAFMLIGFMAIIIEAAGRKTRRVTFLDESIMLHALVLVMLAFHTVIAMTNTFTSLGTIRYLVSTLPCMALIALDGYNIAFEALPRRKNAKTIFAAAVTLLVISGAFSQGRLPIRYSLEQQGFNKLYGWYASSNETGGPLYDRSPYLSYLIGLDPYDPDQSNNIRITLERRPPPGSIIVWDSQHAKLDEKVPLDWFNKSSDYELLTRLDIGDKVLTTSREKFEIYAFKRVT
jgi:hypothetical protein